MREGARERGSEGRSEGGRKGGREGGRENQDLPALISLCSILNVQSNTLSTYAAGMQRKGSITDQSSCCRSRACTLSTPKLLR